MSENERLADQVQTELLRAMAQYLINAYTSEQFLQRIRLIMKSANLS